MMGVLSGKIDFLGIIVAEYCNPNGDPMNGNRPRTNSDGYGEISQECLKRKIRNQLQSMGEEIFVQANDRREDGYNSLNERFQAFIDAYKGNDVYSGACGKWFDVRAFGNVFFYKGTKKEDLTMDVRGPVSITYAKSLEPVNVMDMGITRSMNAEATEGKASDTIVRRHIIDKGVYVFNGSIFPQCAQKTGFSNEDAGKLKQAIMNMFENDASASRPSGSMVLAELYWWEHPCKYGRYNPMRVFQSVKICPSNVFPYYTTTNIPLPNLEPEVLHGI